ncbi:Molybdenum ABC transporter, periplasmic molybdate-binding protein [Citrobacter freundii]|uniref:substrate-binding domain-containing protein n=1 Tax=Citrobacter freundii TaxID=546 RepID=UPI003B24D488
MPSSILLFAAGSLRPAFTPLISQFTRMSGIDVKIEYGPAGLLRDPTLRPGTSTPGCDPSGDYTWAFFDNMDVLEPGLGQQLRARAIPLVGGRDTIKIPQGELASAWILRQGLADLFIGYAHYAHALHAMTDVHYVAIPDEHNICCEYQLAVLDASKEVMALVEFILSRSGQAFLTAAGFLPLNAE